MRRDGILPAGGGHFQTQMCWSLTSMGDGIQLILPKVQIVMTAFLATITMMGKRNLFQ